MLYYSINKITSKQVRSILLLLIDHPSIIKLTLQEKQQHIANYIYIKKTNMVRFSLHGYSNDNTNL